MKNKKFELVAESSITFLGRKLFRIKALVSFGEVSAGDLGGYVEKEENLDHDGNAWVYGDAKVYGNAKVYGDAKVYGNAWVYGNARVCGNADVHGNAWVHGDARVCGNADVYGNADYTTIKGFGSYFRATTFFRCKDKEVRVACGCFFGTIPEFRDKVRETHKETKIAEEYLMIADLMEKHFKE